MNELENDIGSYILERYDNYEPTVFFGRTRRQLILLVGTAISVSLGVLFHFLQYPNILVWLIMGLIMAPTFIYGSGKEEEIKERLLFRLTNQNRSYLTNEEKGKMYDFTQEKSVNEADEADITAKSST